MITFGENCNRENHCKLLFLIVGASVVVGKIVDIVLEVVQTHCIKNQLDQTITTENTINEQYCAAQKEVIFLQFS